MATVDLINQVGRISINDFNALPSISEAWNAIKDIKLNKPNEEKQENNADIECGADYYELLNQTVGQVLIKYGLEDKFSVVLNHMHYKLAAGENQVTCSLKEIENKNGLFYGEYLAEPMKCCVVDIDHNKKVNDKYDLIPIKWRYNKKNNKFESYEYLAVRNIIGSDKFKEIAQIFEKNINLQTELAQAIIATGYDDYFGILLQYYPQKMSKNCEINYEKDRQSKSAIFISDNQEIITKHPSYKQIYESDMELIETSWYFNQYGNIQSGGTCKGHGSTCGSHCYNHK